MEFNNACLVAGGAGFLGSHICKRLLDQNKHVICVDNLISGNMTNIEPFLTNTKFKFIQQDIADVNLVNQFNEFKITEIYNFACIASPKLYKLYPLETLTTCFNGSLSLLNLAKKHNSKYIFASTSEVYGDPLIHPQTETYYGNVNTVGERSCYDEGKRVAETLVYTMRNQYNINAKIIRIFNTYGPRMAKNDGRVVSNFIVAALADANLTIHGTGNQTRSFCYVDDLVDGILKFANSKAIGPINLGNPGEFTVDELASIIVQKVNKGYKQYVERTVDDPQQRKPDITLAKSVLNWEPKVALSEGLDKTIDYFRSV
jgi:UDP-glucuronate decarboxylase